MPSIRPISQLVLPAIAHFRHSSSRAVNAGNGVERYSPAAPSGSVPISAKSTLLWFIQRVCKANLINHELAGLGYRHILIVVGLQALSDALLHTALIPDPEHSATAQFMAQAAGNLLGSMAVVLTLFALATLHRKLA